MTEMSDIWTRKKYENARDGERERKRGRERESGRQR
jgi:hypothetical protein